MISFAFLSTIPVTYNTKCTFLFPRDRYRSRLDAAIAVRDGGHALPSHVQNGSHVRRVLQRQDDRGELKTSRWKGLRRGGELGGHLARRQGRKASLTRDRDLKMGGFLLATRDESVYRKCEKERKGAKRNEKERKGTKRNEKERKGTKRNEKERKGTKRNEKERKGKYRNRVWSFPEQAACSVMCRGAVRTSRARADIGKLITWRFHRLLDLTRLWVPSGCLNEQSSRRHRQIDYLEISSSAGLDASVGAVWVSADLVGLRQRLAAHWPVYRTWHKLSDLPTFNTGVNNSQGLDQEHEICSIGGTSFQWSPLPSPCTQCMKRRRTEFSPALLNKTGVESRRETTFQSVGTTTLLTKPTRGTSSIEQGNAKVLSFGSKGKPKPTNGKTAKAPQATPAGDAKRKTNLQENENEETTQNLSHGQGVRYDPPFSSLKSQGAIKMAGLQDSMHKNVERDQLKYQAIKEQGPGGDVKLLASQTAGGKSFLSSAKPIERSTTTHELGRPCRVAPLFKKTASSVRRNVVPGPSTSKAQPKGTGGREQVKTGETGTLRSCPMCQEEFPPGMSQLETDGHIAACLSASSEDIMW
uniref:UBZ2-type domain-containing protein n=1 Tax=Branchiostoma floridae TaxID=7739 RepID=C3ZVQ8_BRAFL|eukprot:XP_002587389.1 hypothetical protein BRAFLDRAFT_96276 [Branchiostoma floridae]